MILFKVGISGHSFHYFEAMVGVMLVGLAIYRIIKFIRGKKLIIHKHSHVHIPGKQKFGQLHLANEHQHMHVHFAPKSNFQHSHLHSHSHDYSHKLAYGVGLVHGLAGSGALVVLVMAQIKNTFDGLLYLLIFSMGCVVGMLVAAGLFSVPFSKKLIQAPSLQNVLIIATSVLCFLYGSKVIYDNLMLL